MRRPLPTVGTSDGPVSWLGANFWSRTGGPLMWRNYDPTVVRGELGVLASHGVTLTRSFFYWPDFHPTPDSVADTLVERFADFLDAHIENRMTSIPTFLVGHMSGENWDPAWRHGRDLYRDVWMVARQAWFVRTMTERFAGHPAVAGWLISNEMPIYGGSDDSTVVTSWAELMVQAVRAGGGHQPVSIGDGAWGVETTGQHNGYSVRDLGELVDFVGPHVYEMEDDAVRAHLKAGFLCELAAVAGRPVVLEEFGLTSSFASPVNSGHYYRQVLHTSLLGGATGWIAWNNTDYDHLVDQDPYRHHPFEMHFGITDSAGAPKPPLRELAAFRRVLDAVDVTRCERAPTDVALVVPSTLEGVVPFSDVDDRRSVFRATEQAYLAAREADLPVGVVRERDGIPNGYELYLVPSVKALTAPSWRRLGELAESGACVYVSYGPGSSGTQRGPWWTGTKELFGIELELVYGLADPIEADPLVWTFEDKFGSFVAGDTLSFRTRPGAPEATFLPVRATTGTVLAVDAAGRPALVLQRRGAGTLLLGTYPVEHLAAIRARVNPEDTWRLYRALAEHAGVEPAVSVDDPRVLVDGLVHADGRRFVWLISEHCEQITVPLRIRGADCVTPLDGGDPLTEITLAPFGVVVGELCDRKDTIRDR